jgi:hypothetical protein
MSDAPSKQWSDDAITSVTEDRFNRSRFAKLVAGRIDATPIQGDSTVFGLVGPWGSGKSSVANMVGEQLPDTWRVQTFTPWAASGGAALQAEFLAALDSALGGSSAEERQAREALQGYVKWVAPALGLLPVFGAAAQAYTTQVAEAITARAPWAVEFDRMSTRLKDIGVRVLIICDDIDRLDAAELLEFLKVVRLLGRFPNVHYLVVYDGETVEDLLATQGVAGRASSFMEKIVQHPFELPAIDAATHYSLAADALNGVDYAFHEQELDRAGTVVEMLSRGLRTPRQHLRYGQHLKTYFRLVKPEVDFVDFAALSFLRLNHHEVFEAIPELAAELRAGVYNENDNKEGLTWNQWKDRIQTLDRRGEADIPLEILAYFFPRLARSGRAVAHARAFSDYEYMERYYNLGVPSNDVSDQLVAEVIEAIVGGGDAHPRENELLRYFDGANGQARLAFTKARRFREHGEHSATPAGVARMVRILAASSKVVRANGGLESPASEIDKWLVKEVQNAYAAGGLNRDQLIEVLGLEKTIELLLAINSRRRRVSNTDADPMIADFTQHYRARIGSGALAPLGHLRLTLTLLAHVDGWEVVEGILDPFVDGNQNVFEEVTISFVMNQTWWRGEENSVVLEFDKDMWTSAISETVRLKMVPDLEEIEHADQTDDENAVDVERRNIAFAGARATLPAPGAKVTNLVGRPTLDPGNVEEG